MVNTFSLPSTMRSRSSKAALTNSPQVLRGLFQVREAKKTGSLALGLATQYHRTTHGKRLEFDHHACLLPILADNHPKIRVTKAVQVGFSTVLECRALAYVIDGFRVFYVMPDIGLRDGFVQDRINPLLSLDVYSWLITQATERIRVGRSPADAVTLKQLGKGVIIFVGSNADPQFRLYAADVAIVDELDDCKPKNVGRVRGRIAHSQLNWSYKRDGEYVRGRGHDIRCGNPTVRGRGIDAEYTDSDRREWLVACPHCGKRQPLTWWKNVVRRIGDADYELISTGERTDVKIANPHVGPEPEVFCVDCAKPIDRWAAGEWVAQNPEAEAHGYQISQIFCGLVSLREMWGDFVKAQANMTAMQAFVNDRLGEGYESEGNALSPAILQRIVGDYARQTSGDRTFMGIDVGKVFHVTVMNEDRQIIDLMTFTSNNPVDKILELADQYGVATAVADAAPERHLMQQLVEADPASRFWLCEFLTTDRPGDYVLKEDQRIVQIDRTQFMDATHARLVRKEIALFRDALSIPDFEDQMIAPVRTYQEPKAGSNRRGRFVWDEGSKADHFRFSVGYADLAFTLTEEVGEPSIFFA